MRFLDRIGLGRAPLRAWAVYDWANSAVVTVIVTAIFPIYFSKVAASSIAPAQATLRYGVATTAALAIIALLSPLLGALADRSGRRKAGLALCVAGGSLAVAGMFGIGQGDWVLASALLIVANIGLNGSIVFSDSLLPHLAAPEEVDRVSTAGYALGYLGGGLLLAASLLLIERPALFGMGPGGGTPAADPTLPTRIVFAAAGLWWAVFSIPLLRVVREPPALAPAAGERGAIVSALSRLGRTLREIRTMRQAALFLVAFLVYNDGIGTIVRMATVYGTEIGIGRGALIGAILLVQVIGVPCSFLFGSLAGRFGAKRMILFGLAVYAVVTLIGYFMTTATHFFLLAALVGLVQGGTQALSRSLFAAMIPPSRSAELFGFFAVSEKFAGILGPAIFSATIALTGSSRSAILFVIVFFVVGGGLLLRVDVEEGKRAASGS